MSWVLVLSTKTAQHGHGFAWVGELFGCERLPGTQNVNTFIYQVS